jgi:hypothetical protein
VGNRAFTLPPPMQRTSGYTFKAAAREPRPYFRERIIKGRIGASGRQDLV